MIRQQLETRETPLLYCMLGDATDELEHYNKALAMTEGRSARAHRALGMHYYFRKEYGQAVEHLSRSLELNSFQGRNSGLIRISLSCIWLMFFHLVLQKLSQIQGW